MIKKITGFYYSRLFILAVLLLFSMAALPAQAQGPDDAAGQGISQVKGVVTVNSLNIRSGPGTTYGLVTVVYRGQSLTLTGRTADSAWLRVNAGSYSGWAYAAYVYSDWPIGNLPVVNGGEPGPNPFGYVGVPYLNLRSGPGLNYPIVGGLERNTELGLIGRTADNTWVQISWGPGGGSAWVYARYIWTSYPINNLPVTDGGTQPRPSARVAVYQMNFRDGPGLTFPIVANLGRGAMVTLLGRNNDGSWVMVDLGNGRVAWAYTPLLQTSYPVMNLPLIMTGG